VILNLGSINIDHVYRVERFVRPGETLASQDYARSAGGKGLNQSVALARAGAAVRHLGAIGEDGRWLRDRLAGEGVDVGAVREVGGATGHAIIQVAASGENCIVLHAGANRRIDGAAVDAALAAWGPGDVLLTQNETTAGPAALVGARRRGLQVWFNPAPMTPEIGSFPLEAVDWLVVNEAEGAALAGRGEPAAILQELRARWPRLRPVLTLGAAGVWCAEAGALHRVAAPRVAAVDTTAAGDTFVGYLLAGIVAGLPVPAALDRACRAAAIGVTRRGAAASIPYAAELK